MIEQMTTDFFVLIAMNYEPFDSTKHTSDMMTTLLNNDNLPTFSTGHVRSIIVLEALRLCNKKEVSIPAW